MVTSCDVLIVGTGFSGLGMAARLRAAGNDDLVLLEAADSVGGTWRDNTYPGAACDIPSHLYSFSFAPNPRWTRAYAPQAEIRAYLERVTDDLDLRRHIRFNARVTRAAWEDGAWSVATADGGAYRARALVLGCGGLSRPSLPEIPGRARFAGVRFHSARWDHGAELDGMRVGVIGTGASAIQIVPQVARRAGRLEVFQRTPPWILSHPDRPIGPAWRALFRALPFTQRVARAAQFVRCEARILPFVYLPKLGRAAERMARRFLEESVPPGALRDALTPSYRIGCKRVLISNDYYPALQRPNVELCTDGIERIDPRGVVTRGGALHELDVLILATGFEAAEAAAPFEVRGRDGLSLDEAWRGGAEAYLGATVHGFPGMYLLVGPNCGLGHNSMILMIESQIAYVASAIAATRILGPLEVRREAQERYNRELQARFAGTVWTTGCNSWYHTRSGKNTTLWPGTTIEFRRRTRRFDPRAYASARD